MKLTRNCHCEEPQATTQSPQQPEIASLLIVARNDVSAYLRAIDLKATQYFPPSLVWSQLATFSGVILDRKSVV